MNNSIEKEDVLVLLKHVIDPELMINIVDLGLVYDVFISDEKVIAIHMTLTSEGCPLGDVIMEDIVHILSDQCEGYKVDVQLVWEPEWSPERLTAAGKAALEGIV